MSELVCLIVFIGISTIFAMIMIIAGFLCQYKKECSIKNSTYECGILPFCEANIKFDIKYFNYAIIFLIFDIETIFLYPFAVSTNNLGLFAVFEAFVFVLILLIGLYIAIKKKVLRWL